MIGILNVLETLNNRSNLAMGIDTSKSYLKKYYQYIYLIKTFNEDSTKLQLYLPFFFLKGLRIIILY